MKSIKFFTKLTFLALCLCGTAQAQLKYQQTVTMSYIESHEKLLKDVMDFCEATKGDKDIQVMDIAFSESKIQNDTLYSATLTCHVSNPDQDLMRTQGKVYKNKYMVE